jgi:hypothetical protein
VDIPLEQFITTDMINKNEIYTMKFTFLYIPESLVIDFLIMNEMDEMWKIENSKITQIFSLGNPHGRTQLEGEVAMLYFL